MSEATPTSHEQAPYSPDEQVGDIYQVQIDDRTGQVADADAEKLTAPPSIWVGSWLDYNNGNLHGAWINAAQDDAAIEADIQAMLAASPTSRQTGEPAEDWGVFDHDNFGPLRIDQEESIAWIGKVGRGIAEHGLAYAAYADVVQDEAALDSFGDDYIGRYESVEAYAESMTDDLGYNQLLDRTLPDCIRRYVRLDTAQIAHDLVANSELHVVPSTWGGCWLFHAR